MQHAETTLAVLNFLVCTACFWACLCRLNAMTIRVPRTVRAQFVGLLVGSVASGLQPMLFAQKPGIGQLIFSTAVLLCLMLSMHRWRDGPPNDLAHQGD